IVRDLDGIVPQEHEQNPGAYIHFNLDNDNNSDNSLPSLKHPGGDYAEVIDPVVGEDDLMMLTIDLDPDSEGPNENLVPDTGCMKLSIGNDNCKLWGNRLKGQANLVLDGEGCRIWNLEDDVQRSDFMSLIKKSLYVEGVTTGSSNLTMTCLDPAAEELCNLPVKYTFIAANCGDQPRTEGVYFPNLNESEKAFFSRKYSSLKHCEWNIVDAGPTGHWPDARYNCIARSIDDTLHWYTQLRSISGTNIIGIDEVFGDGDDVWDIDGYSEYTDTNGNGWYDEGEPWFDANRNGICDRCDIHEFYAKMKGWKPVAEGPADAEAVFYSGYHAARRSHCSCGDGKWTMYLSKCGEDACIEHRTTQLSEYGAKLWFYK
ncbi:hypothetical protein JW905_01050, partial [bacterium]|nr:hypothetical protein [candidate division CSSED10-310 bacterium]